MTGRTGARRDREASTRSDITQPDSAVSRRPLPEVLGSAPAPLFRARRQGRQGPSGLALPDGNAPGGELIAQAREQEPGALDLALRGPHPGQVEARLGREHDGPAGLVSL